MKLADVQFSDHERVVVARLTGEIDLSNADSIEGAIAEATPNHALALILDVSALDYLDSAGIHLIYKLREKLRARGQAPAAGHPGRLARQRRSAAGRRLAQRRHRRDASTRRWRSSRPRPRPPRSPIRAASEPASPAPDGP